jgi:LmbE family N-acetylglucosaminyl deacetylase
MNWIYLSPHLDDVVLSCGGVISEQIKAGDQVQVWTICAGDPPVEQLTVFAQKLHSRWNVEKDAVSKRREEDRLACNWLGAISSHYNFPDCIYRFFPDTSEPVVKSDKDLFRKFDLREEFLVRQLHQILQESIPESAKLVLPLTIGNHVDHQLTRLAGEGISPRCCYYAEYPYVLNPQFEINRAIKKVWQEIHYSVEADSLLSWQRAVSAYQSQISTFWADIPAMYAAIYLYWQKGGGAMLWCEEL